MSEITIQTLKPGVFVKYGDRRCKVYKVEQERLLIAVIVGMKKWVKITSVTPWVEE